MWKVRIWVAEKMLKFDNPVLMSRDLSLWYGDNQALNRINMEIPAREVTAIIGPSGCGKSTFLKTINRMTDLVEGVRLEGALEFLGRPLKDYDVVELRRRVGMVFQRPNPFPKSIYENIVFGLRLVGERRRAVLDEVVERSLRQAALWDEVKDRLHSSALELSGGQQQRLCTARALAVNPEVILMDEPTSALDPVASAKIEELIIRLKEEYTILIVTHNMQQAARISDQTAFFLSGELVEYSKTDELFETPASPKTEDFITGRFG
ncbi:MAG: phosphate ABC transporter ATP-binding protein [Firmicutes bacterium]|jgi:phosphate transport system ATP-binding protein|nr:phosphate ABC transporter ATP-binding protein [Bacillota bacterium]